jgi:hypothetical protein
MKCTKLTLNIILTVLVLLEICSVYSVPIKPGGMPFNKPRVDDEYACSLPASMHVTGRMLHLEDCTNLTEYEKFPVPAKWPDGNVVKLCCPNKAKDEHVCFPSDPWCPTYESQGKISDGTANVDIFDIRTSDLILEEEEPKYTCSSSMACVSLHSCGGITSPEVNHFCGMKSDQVMVCCSNKDILDISTSPQPPRFPDAKGAARKCEDLTPYCGKWKYNKACEFDSQKFSTGDLRVFGG